MWIKIPADEELDAAKDRIAELEAALERSGRHRGYCEKVNWTNLSKVEINRGTECTCGLDALKGGE